jgi:hypothetical protein
MLSDDNEDYTKLKAIVKESIKAVLSDNKTLISAAFAALVQTLQNDPQMVNLIYRIPNTANDGEQHKDNNDNNSITKYLELKKDKILDLAERNYENLVEALTNNVMNTAANSSFNSTLPSSSTIPNLSNQSDIYRKEETETYHNSKGDIAG